MCKGASQATRSAEDLTFLCLGVCCLLDSCASHENNYAVDLKMVIGLIFYDSIFFAF